MPQAKAYVNGYTVLLFVYGFLLVAGTVVMYSVAAREEDTAWALRMAGNIEAILGAACLAVGVLRSRGSPVAGPATAAISIILSISFPFGTAAFVWWLVSIRKQERAAAPGPG